MKEKESVMDALEQSLNDIRDIGQQVLDYHASVVERVEYLRLEILELRLKQSRKRKVSGA